MKPVNLHDIQTTQDWHEKLRRTLCTPWWGNSDFIVRWKWVNYGRQCGRQCRIRCCLYSVIQKAPYPKLMILNLSKPLYKSTVWRITLGVVILLICCFVIRFRLPEEAISYLLQFWRALYLWDILYPGACIILERQLNSSRVFW